MAKILIFLQSSCPAHLTLPAPHPHSPHTILIFHLPTIFPSSPRLSMLPCMRVFWLWRFLIQTQRSFFSLRVPCTAKKRADTLTPWTLTRLVPSYLFFPALLVFSPVPLLFSSQASGAILLLSAPKLCFAFYNILKFAPLWQLPISTPLVPIFLVPTHLLYKATFFLLCSN